MALIDAAAATFSLMTTLVAAGPPDSPASLAAHKYRPDATLIFCRSPRDAVQFFVGNTADFAVIPVYNTHEGQEQLLFDTLGEIEVRGWVDNIVLPAPLALGAPLFAAGPPFSFKLVIGTVSTIRQCGAYIERHLDKTDVLTTTDMDTAISKARSLCQDGWCIVDTETNLKNFGLEIIARDIAPLNRTRFAILGRSLSPRSGYDATVLLTRPLRDRVGLLYDILSEFTSRGINILDIRSEPDLYTQKLRFYLEVEGHADDAPLSDALSHIETSVIREQHALRILGSFPRVDMRSRDIRTICFIGTGDMSRWFADRLAGEGYTVQMSGRSSNPPPEALIPGSQVVCVCVPISATPAVIERYGPLLGEGQALVILAGEAQEVINAAMKSTAESVELLLVHNLWGPQAPHMKDKNAIIVRTRRSGRLSSEFEAFLYKHGVAVFHDSPAQHDLLMGVCQKLPSIISVAMASTLAAHGIATTDVRSHATLTSQYLILAMARLHSQNPATYAEILAAPGEGQKILESFSRQLLKLLHLANSADREEICRIIDANRAFLSHDFLTQGMEQAQKVDRALGDRSF